MKIMKPTGPSGAVQLCENARVSDTSSLDQTETPLGKRRPFWGRTHRLSLFTMLFLVFGKVGLLSPKPSISQDNA